MSGRIVVFGATGYTGAGTARELVARGARPVLAARSAERLEALSAELGGLETRVADVSRPETVRALVERGDVLVTTVGPFVRWGDPAAEAAVAAGAHYLDSTGEPAFIRRIFDGYGPRASAAGSALVTAFGFDYVPGNLAGALALRAAGPAAVRVDIGYFSRGPLGVSGGTRASAAGVLLERGYAFRDGALRAERTGARVALFTLADGRRREGLSVGGSEHLALPGLHPTLRDVDVVLGLSRAVVRAAPVVSRAVGLVTALPPVRALVTSVVRRMVSGSTGGPDDDARAKGGCTVVAEARSASGEVIERVRLDGPNPYDLTFRLLAWGAMTAATGGLTGTGALGPVQAFGLDPLRDAAAAAGLVAA